MAARSVGCAWRPRSAGNGRWSCGRCTAPSSGERVRGPTQVPALATAAREAAQARGKATGRPRALTPAQLRQARQLRDAGESMADIVQTLGVARSTLYRALSEPDNDAATSASST
jgi:helix-turn-helix resolvase-like protein